MNDFDRRFKARQEEFDKEWKQAKKWYWVGSMISAIIGLSLMGFFIWVIIMVMRFFGVI